MTGLSKPLTPSSPMPLDSLSPSRLEYLEASEEVVLELCVDEVVVVSSLSSEDMTTAANGVDDVELFAVLLLVFVDPFGSISGHLARVFVCFSIELTVDREREREIWISCSTGIQKSLQFILYESGKSAPLTRSLLISSSIC